MQKYVLVLTTSTFVLACSAIAASAQQSPGIPMTQQPGQQQTQQQPPGQEDSGMMGHGGMMGRGKMGGGAMGPPIMFRMVFALMDDGDGQISLQEFQAAHERIFKAMDANKDGRLTMEEMQGFMHGTRTVPRQ